MHKEVYELHKDNPDTSVGFQIEFLQFSMLKDDKTQPVILEEVCEDDTDAIVKTEKSDKDDMDNMQYVLVPRKKKLKRASGKNTFHIYFFLELWIEDDLGTSFLTILLYLLCDCDIYCKVV